LLGEEGKEIDFIAEIPRGGKKGSLKQSNITIELLSDGICGASYLILVSVFQRVFRARRLVYLMLNGIGCRIYPCGGLTVDRSDGIGHDGPRLFG